MNVYTLCSLHITLSGLCSKNFLTEYCVRLKLNRAFKDDAAHHKLSPSNNILLNLRTFYIQPFLLVFENVWPFDSHNIFVGFVRISKIMVYWSTNRKLQIEVDYCILSRGSEAAIDTLNKLPEYRTVRPICLNRS